MYLAYAGMVAYMPFTLPPADTDDGGGVGSVIIIFDATGLSDSDKFTSIWWLNSEVDPSSLTFTYNRVDSTGPATDTISQPAAFDPFNAAGPASSFDTRFDWNTSNAGGGYVPGDSDHKKETCQRLSIAARQTFRISRCARADPSI